MKKDKKMNKSLSAEEPDQVQAVQDGNKPE